MAVVFWILRAKLKGSEFLPFIMGCIDVFFRLVGAHHPKVWLEPNFGHNRSSLSQSWSSQNGAGLWFDHRIHLDLINSSLFLRTHREHAYFQTNWITFRGWHRMQDAYGTLRSHALLRGCCRFGYPHTVANTVVAGGAVWRGGVTACFRKR